MNLEPEIYENVFELLTENKMDKALELLSRKTNKVTPEKNQ